MQIGLFNAVGTVLLSHNYPIFLQKIYFTRSRVIMTQVIYR